MSSDGGIEEEDNLIKSAQEQENANDVKRFYSIDSRICGDLEKKVELIDATADNLANQVQAAQLYES